MDLGFQVQVEFHLWKENRKKHDLIEEIKRGEKEKLKKKEKK